MELIGRGNISIDIGSNDFLATISSPAQLCVPSDTIYKFVFLHTQMRIFAAAINATEINDSQPIQCLQDVRIRSETQLISLPLTSAPFRK